MEWKCEQRIFCRVVQLAFGGEGNVEPLLQSEHTFLDMSGLSSQHRGGTLVGQKDRTPFGTQDEDYQM